LRPGFNERTFEFCFNAEYCQLNMALLATHPHIPSTRAEKDLGYDVEFRIKEGKFTKSLFLQHKVSSFAQTRAGRNAEFWAAHEQPYFRFTVDNDQHNVLCKLSEKKSNAFYCAPIFHWRHELETRFRAMSIGAGAVFLDPSDVGKITDTKRHNITYDGLGQDPTLHSEPLRFKNAYRADKEHGPRLKVQPVTEEYVAELSRDLMNITSRQRMGREIANEVQTARPIERVQVLLGRVYQVTWLLLP